MLKFEEEIKKFKPSLEVDHIEQDVQENQIEDLLDIFRYATKKNAEEPKKNQADKE